MGEFVLTDAGIYVDERNLTGESNNGRLAVDVDLVDVSKFGDTWHRRIPGVANAEVEIAGFWNADGTDGFPDKFLFDKVGAEDNILSIIPEGLNDGNVAFLLKNIQGAYEFGGEYGGAIEFSFSAASQGEPPVRGKVMGSGSKVATGDGTAYNEGAVSATQYLYAALHVISVSGTSPTLDMIIESDTVEAFTGSPSTRITFAQKTAVGHEYATRVAGPITDTWWRAGWTIGGSSPNFSVVVVMGIV